MAFDLLLRIGSDIKGFSDGMAEMSGVIDKNVGEVETKLRGLDSVGSALQGLGAGLTAGLTLPLVGVGAAAIRVSEQLGQARLAFTTMLGDGQRAQVFLEGLKGFAATTPFEFPELVQASQKMLAFGFNADQVIPTLRSIGDAASALGGGTEVINGITTALGQMQAKGKVSAEEMMQLAERGVPAWDILAKAIGVSIPEAMKLAEQGAISATTAIPALVEGMNTRFGGQMQVMSQMLTGVWSNFKDTATLALGEVGGALAPVAKQIIQDFAMPALAAFKELASQFAALSPETQKIIIGAGAMVAAIGPLILVVGTLLGSISNIAGGITALATAFGATGTAATTVGGALGVLGTALSPIGIAVAAVAGAFAAWKLAEWADANIKWFHQALETLKGGVDNVWSAVGPLVSAVGEFGEVIGKLAIHFIVEAFKNLWTAIEPIASAVGGAAAAFGRWALDRIADLVRGVTGAFEGMVGALKNIPGVSAILDSFKTKVDDSHKSAGDAKKSTAEMADAVKDAGNQANTSKGHFENLATSKGKVSAAAKAAKDEAKALEGALKDLGGESYKTETTVNKLNAEMALIDKAFKDGKISASQHAEAVKTYKEKVAEAITPSGELKSALGLLKVETDDSEKKTKALNEALETARNAYFNGKLPLNDYVEAQKNHKLALDALKDPLASINTELQNLILHAGNAKTNVEALNVATMNAPSLLQVMNTEIINQGLAVSASNAQLATMNQRIGTEMPAELVKAGGGWTTMSAAAGTAMTGIQTGVGTMVTTVGAQGAALAADLTGKLFSGEGSWIGIGQKALGLFTGDWKSFTDNAAGLIGGFAQGAIAKLFGGGADSLKSQHGTSTAAMPGDWKKYADASITNVGGFISGAIGKLFGGGNDSLKTQHATGLGQIAGDYDTKLKVPALQHVGSLVSGAIGALVSGEGSFGDRVKAMLPGLVSAFASMAASWVTEATGLKDTLNGIFSQIKPPNLGSLGSIGGGSTPGAPGGGANTGGGGGSFFDVAGVVSQISSAITGIIGVFQAARQENSLNAIEENTRDTESEVRNLRSDDWLRETHLMTKLDDLFQFTWIKLDDLFQFTWIKLDEIINGVGGGGSAAAPVDLGLLTQATQAVESHTNTLVTDVGGFRKEVSTGFGNSMLKADDLWGTLQNIETNTKKGETVADPVPGLLGSLADGLRNINLTGQGVIGAIQALGTKLNPEPGHKSMDRAANFTSAIHDFVRDSVVPRLNEIHGRLLPQYQYYDRIEKAIAARVQGGNAVNVQIDSIYLGNNQTLSRASVDQLASSLGNQLQRAIALQGAS